MYLDSSPLYGLFTLGALWSLVEPEEDKGETEEPKMCMSEQAKFNWACTWLEEGGTHVLGEDKAQGLLSQVFGLPRPFSVLLYSSVLFLCPNL